MIPRLLKIQEAADRLACSRWTVRRLIAEGKIKVVRGRGTSARLDRIHEADLQSYIDGNRRFVTSCRSGSAANTGSSMSVTVRAALDARLGPCVKRGRLKLVSARNSRPARPSSTV